MAIKIFRQSNRRLAGWIVTALLIGAVLFWSRGFIQNLIVGWHAPLAAAGLGVRSLMNTVLGGPGCSVDQVRTLEQRIQDLAFDRVRLEESATENKILRETIGYLEKHTWGTVAAKIVSRSATQLNQRWLIDRGAEDGLTIGDPVIVGAGNLLGKVSELSAQSAVVTGIGDSRSAVAAALLNQNKTIGIVRGAVENRLTLNFIPKDEAVAVNNLVVTSGLEDNVPSGLVIGVITAVNTDPNTPFLEAIVEPLTDLRRHQIVLIITDK